MEWQCLCLIVKDGSVEIVKFVCHVERERRDNVCMSWMCLVVVVVFVFCVRGRGRR